MSEIPQDPAAPSDPPPQQSSTPPPTPPPPAGGQAPVYGQQTPAPGQPGLAPVSPSDARMWSMLTHIGGIFFGFIPSLIVYLVYKDRDPFLRRHAVQALNFQIIMTIGLTISWMLTALFIGFLLVPAVWICMVVFSIIAAMAANKGEEYTYPMVPQMVT